MLLESNQRDRADQIEKQIHNYTSGDGIKAGNLTSGDKGIKAGNLTSGDKGI